MNLLNFWNLSDLYWFIIYPWIFKHRLISCLKSPSTFHASGAPRSPRDLQKCFHVDSYGCLSFHQISPNDIQILAWGARPQPKCWDVSHEQFTGDFACSIVPCLQISAKYGFILLQREVLWWQHIIFVSPASRLTLETLAVTKMKRPSTCGGRSNCGRNHGSFTRSDICSIDSEPEILLIDNILHQIDVHELLVWSIPIGKRDISSMISVPQAMTFYCNSRPSTFADTKTLQWQHFSPVPFEGTGNSGR